MQNWYWIRHAKQLGCAEPDPDPPIEPRHPIRTDQLPKDAFWISSPLRRAKETAALIGTKKPTLIPGFAEQNFGRWEGFSWNALEEREPDHYRVFWNNPVDAVPPEGESFRTTCKRVVDAIKDITTKGKERIIVVSHAGPIRAAIGLALGMDFEQRINSLLAIDIPYLHVLKMDFISEGNWVLHMGRNIESRIV